MSDKVKATGATVWEFRMAIFWFLLFSLNSLGTSILASLTGTQWDTLDSQSKFMIVVAVTVNWTGTIMAFVSRQSARIKKTGDIFPEDTTFITKPPAPVSKFAP